MEGSERQNHTQEGGARKFLTPEIGEAIKRDSSHGRDLSDNGSPEDYMRRCSFIRTIDAWISGRHSGCRSPVSSRK